MAAQTWSISLNTETHESSIFRAGYGTEISRLYVDEISQRTFTNGKWLNNQVEIIDVELLYINK